MASLLLALLLACGSDKDPAGGMDDGTGDGTGDGGTTDTTSPDSGGGDGGTAIPPDDSYVDAIPDDLLTGVSDSHGGVPLKVDPDLNDPLSAWADCASTISACLHDSDADYDRCVAEAPTCGTDEPWTEGPCCPSACKSAYSDAVAGGRSGMDAYIQVFAVAPTCFPGVGE